MRLYFAALALARALDAGSSCYALAHGAREANPLMPSSCAGQISMQMAATAAQTWGFARLAKTHPRAARVLTVVTVGVEVGISLHNLHSAR